MCNDLYYTRHALVCITLAGEPGTGSLPVACGRSVIQYIYVDEIDMFAKRVEKFAFFKHVQITHSLFANSEWQCNTIHYNNIILYYI